MTDNPLIYYNSPLHKYANLALSAALSPLERILTNQGRAMETPPICFIVGVPRSGTTLLYELMATQFHCAYFSNFAKRLFRVPVAATWLIRNAIRNRQGSFDSRYGELEGLAAPNEAGRIWIHWMPYAAPYNLPLTGLKPAEMRAKMAAMGHIMGGPTIIKNPILQADFTRIINYFPDALFLYVERDWSENARSLVKGREVRTASDGTGWFSLRPNGWKEYAGTDPVTQSCAQVVLSHNDLRNGFSALPDQSRVKKVGYEALCADPEGMLAQIAEFLTDHGFPADRKESNDSANTPAIRLRTQEDDETKRRILSILSAMSDKYGLHPSDVGDKN